MSSVQIERAPASTRTIPWAELAVAVIFAFGFTIPSLLGGTYYMTLAISGVLLGILALCIAFLMNQCGLVFFGIATFYGLGAYGFGILTSSLGLHAWSAIAATIVLCSLVALGIGALIVRVKPLAFMMITLSLGELLHHMTTLPWMRPYTNGADGMILAFDGKLFGYGDADLLNPATIWPIVWVTTSAVSLLLYLVAKRRLGRTLRAIKENEERMRFSGFNTYAPRVIAFTLSGAIASIAGILQALFSGFVSPDIFGLVTSTNALLAAITGGISSIAGPIVGGVVFAAAQDEFGALGFSLLFTGIAVIAVIVLMPRGVLITSLELANRLGQSRTRGANDADR